MQHWKQLQIIEEGDNDNNNLPFRWQRPLGESMFLIFCCMIRRDEEKETQNRNVGEKNKNNFKLSKQGEHNFKL